MGDRRFVAAYERLLTASDRATTLARLSDDEVVQALAAASGGGDPLMANILATEAMNRMRRSRAITEHLGAGAFAADGDAVLRYVNPGLTAILGGHWTDYVSRVVEEAFVLADLAGNPVTGTPACPIRQALERGERREWEGSLSRVGADAAVRVELMVAPILADGDVQGTVGAFRDVTQRRRAEEAVHESEARFRSFVESSPVGIFSLDDTGAITSLNPAGERIVGYDAGELLGTIFLPLLPEREHERAFANLVDVLDGHTRTDEYEILRKDGERVRLRITGIPRWQGGRVVGIHGIAEDITRAAEETARMEARIRELEARLAGR